MRYKGVADSRSKKTGEFVTSCAAVFMSVQKFHKRWNGPPGAERQKGGLYVDIKRTEENRESC